VIELYAAARPFTNHVCVSVSGDTTGVQVMFPGTDLLSFSPSLPGHQSTHHWTPLHVGMGHEEIIQWVQEEMWRRVHLTVRE